MNTDGTVFDFSAIAVVLPRNTDRVTTALVGPRFVDGPNGLRVSMIFGDDLLAAVAEQFFIPLDRLEESL